MSAFGAEKTDAFAELDAFLTEQGTEEAEQHSEEQAQPTDEFDDLFVSKGADTTGDEVPADDAASSAPAAAPAVQSSDDLRDAVAQLARLTAEREAREARAQQMLDEEQRAKQSRVSKPFESVDLELTEEERQVYGQSEGVISKVAKSAVQSYHDQFVAPLLEELRQYREDTQNIKQSVVHAQEQTVMSRLGATVPDLDARTRSAGWQDFVNRQAPYMQRGVTMGQLIEHHLKAGDVDAAAEVIRAYEFQGNTPARVAATTPAPKRVGGGGPPASVAARQAGSEMLPISRFNKATEMAERGQITPERYNAIIDVYLKAEAEGLVDYAK